MNRKMKDSGVEWIGEIPEDWEVSRLRRFCKFKTGSTPSTSNKEWFDGDLKWFTPVDFTENYILNNSKRTLSIKAKNDNVATIIPKDAIMLVCIGTIGKIGITTEECSCNQQITAIITNKLYPKYIMYWLIANEKVLKDTTNYTIVPILNNQNIGNYLLIYPNNFDEQEKIAETLDKKCTQIDTLIQNQQQQIEKLKQYKQSLITETVTKGLEPNVPMKDSGVEWIGEIPEDWEVKQIGDVSNVTKLAGFEFTNYFEYIEDGEVIAIRGLNLKNLDIDLSNIRRISLEVSNQLLRSKVNKNDVLISYAGTVGSIGVIRNTDFKYHLAPNVGKITPISVLNSMYLGYFLISFSGQENINILKNKNAQESISMSNIRKLNVLLPPLEEQEKIANYLDKKCSQIDNLIKIKEEKIQKLNDYKKSIIYEYVTGKKEA